MAYSWHRRNALDANQPFAHRASRARSCARHVADKFWVHRDVIIDRVRELSGVDMYNFKSGDEIATAIALLEKLRFSWPA